MSKVIKLKKGLDIKLNGEAEKVVQPAGKITSCALKPTDFRAMTPKLAVKVGDEVKAGDVLFIDKTHPEIKFTTPVSGTIEAINRGERRKLLEVVVKADAETRYRDFGKTEVSKLNRDEIIDRLLESGVWPLIKQRPYDIIADPMSTESRFRVGLRFCSSGSGLRPDPEQSEQRSSNRYRLPLQTLQ